jgi:Tfp pilus assembly protein PilN
MKEEINLLAPAVKVNRLQELYQQRGRRLWWRAVFSVGLVVAVLAVSYGLLLSSKRAMQQKLATTQAADQSRLAQVRSTTVFLNAVRAVINDSFSWTPRLETVLAIVPPTVQLSEIAGRESDAALLITGVTASRITLVDFQKQLEGLAWVKQVEAPLRNFATGTTGEFTFIIYPKEE